MANYYNKNLDDPIELDGVQSFEGGQVSSVRSNLIPPNASAELKNMDVGRYGSITTRRGTNSLLNPASSSNRIQGLGWFKFPGSNFLMAVQNTGVYRHNGTAWSGVLSGYTASTAGALVDMAQMASSLYLLDGSQRLCQYDGTAFTLLQPASQPNALDAGYSYLVNHTNRIFAWGLASAPDKLRASGILDATSFLAAFSLQVGGSDGDAIVACVPWIDFNLVVLKANSVWVVNADPSAAAAADWAINVVHKTIGCVARRTACQVGDDVWFLASDGVRSVGRIELQNQNEVSEPLSRDVQDIIERINWSAASASCAMFWNNRYFLSVPVDSSSDPNYTLVYNTLVQKWTGYWIGWAPTIFASTYFSNNPRMVFGQTNGVVLQWRDFIAEDSEQASDFQDAGVDIASFVKTRSLTFSELFNSKSGRNLELEFFKSTANVDISTIIDQGGEDLLWSGSTLGDGVFLPVVLPFNLIAEAPKRIPLGIRKFQRFREIQAKVSADAGKISLRNVLATGFVDTLQMAQKL